MEKSNLTTLHHLGFGIFGVRSQSYLLLNSFKTTYIFCFIFLNHSSLKKNNKELECVFERIDINGAVLISHPDITLRFEVAILIYFGLSKHQTLSN